MGHWQTDWDRGALQRIVALLFALANLADRAAGAPLLGRRRVLCILNWGETEARAFLIGMACGEPVAVDALEPSGDVADLATRLRALALMLTLLSGRCSTHSGAAGPQVSRPRHAVAGQAVRRPPAPPVSDTS